MAQAVSHLSFIAETRFDFRPTHVTFMVDEVALGQVFTRYLFFSVSVIPSMLHTYLYPYFGVIRKEKERSVRTAKKKSSSDYWEQKKSVFTLSLKV
jgi:hypothetical protein